MKEGIHLRLPASPYAMTPVLKEDGKLHVFCFFLHIWPLQTQPSLAPWAPLKKDRKATNSLQKKRAARSSISLAAQTCKDIINALRTDRDIAKRKADEVLDTASPSKRPKQDLDSQSEGGAVQPLPKPVPFPEKVRNSLTRLCEC
jgi:hypothetical protein